MDPKKHWETVYETKKADAVSWYAPHLEKSLELIGRLAPNCSASIIDVGGGESTLIDDLLARGYRDLTVLDISQHAIEVARQRMGAFGDKVTWLADDIIKAALPNHRFDIWHDRAVFHFLTTESERQAYVRQVVQAVKPGGFVIVATFGPEGPTKCSGLDTVRYDATTLHAQFGARFRLMGNHIDIHQTPFGTQQQFLYCYCRIEGGDS